MTMEYEKTLELAPDEDQDVIDELGLSRYRKTILATAAAVAVIVALLFSAPVAAAVAAVLAAYGVYRVPNAS
jgi:hypothetical protein